MSFLNKMFGNPNDRQPQLSPEAQDWNQMVMILSTKNINDLNDKQKTAYYIWHYDSEVQNGGHLQYFQNSSKDELNNTEKSLKQVGAENLAGIYAKAFKAFELAVKKEPENVEEYLERENVGEFEKIDQEYYSIDVNDILEKYLQENRDIILIGE